MSGRTAMLGKHAGRCIQASSYANTAMRARRLMADNWCGLSRVILTRVQTQTSETVQDVAFKSEFAGSSFLDFLTLESWSRIPLTPSVTHVQETLYLAPSVFTKPDGIIHKNQ